MLGGGIPIGLGNSQPFVSGFHVAAHVNARATGSHAKLIQNMLPQALLRVVAEASEEPFELLISRQPRDEFIDYGRDRIIAAQARIQRLLFLSDYLGVNGRRAESERRQKDYSKG